MRLLIAPLLLLSLECSAATIVVPSVRISGTYEAIGAEYAGGARSGGTEGHVWGEEFSVSWGGSYSGGEHVYSAWYKDFTLEYPSYFYPGGNLEALLPNGDTLIVPTFYDHSTSHSWVESYPGITVYRSMTWYQPVPEPATIGLSAGAFIVFAVFHLRRGK
jgi:hypothetical protein